MRAPTPGPCAPTHDPLLELVDELIAEDDWGRVLLRTFYLAHNLPSYRQAAARLRIGPAGVTQRICSLHKLLAERLGAAVTLVTQGDRGPETTEQGDDVMDILEEAFPSIPRRRRRQK